MAITAAELTKLLTEAKKARESLDKVLDFVDLINKQLDNLSADVKTSGIEIKDQASVIEEQIEQIRQRINSELDKIPVDADEVKQAAHKLLLYQGHISQVIHWAEGQQKGHPVNSYWWRYWQAVSDIIKGQQGQQ
jgi:hypothetical protein